MKNRNKNFFKKWATKRKHGKLLYVFFNSITTLLIVLLLYAILILLIFGKGYAYTKIFCVKTVYQSLLLLIPIVLINLRQWKLNE